MANVIFMGTPEIAVPTMRAIHKAFGLSAVVTVPDKPKGRGLKLSQSDVKLAALELGVEILQPEDLKSTEFVDRIKEIAPDIIVVFAFRILPKEVYSLAKIATFNIHTSLLPKYRGAAPINWAIINGETETGLSAFLLNDIVDTGDIINQHKVIIPYNSTAGDLTDILSQHSPAFAIDTCKILFEGTTNTIKQPKSFVSPAPKLFRHRSSIDWSYHVIEIMNYINGHSPVPCAWTLFDGKILKIYRVALPILAECDAIAIKAIASLTQPGEWLIDRNKFFVNCGVGVIELKEIQIEGKKRTKITDFINGYRGEKRGMFSMMYEKDL